VSPRITVLMPVYNAGPFVADAARSVLSGSWRDLELLAIDDGSTDESAAVLEALGDPRVRVIRNKENRGLIAALNRGLDLARGELIARMDADDICMPDRLSRQLAFMDANPEIGVSGTWITVFGAGREHLMRFPTDPQVVDTELFCFNPIAHSTVMLRKPLFDRYALRYSPDAVHVEDLDLWMRAAEHFALANISAVGVRYRVHARQVSAQHETLQNRSSGKLRARQLSRLLPLACAAEVDLHLAVMDVNRALRHEELIAAAPWLERLERANASVRRYDPSKFREFLVQRWLNAAYRCVPGDFGVWRTWRRSALATVGAFSQWRLFLKKAMLR
jgi:glycosyltransferase involved in cell wall biosynthesis